MNAYQQGFEMPSHFEQQMEEVKLDMREMRTAITELAKAMSRLTVLEERNSVTNLAVEKVASRIERTESKVRHIELEQAKFIASVDGMSKTMKWMWGAFGGGVLYVASQVFQALIPYLAK